MRVLVTGGAGFIGAHLVCRLHHLGHEVTVLDALSPQIHGGDPSATSALYAKIQGKCRFILGSVTDPTAVRAALAECGAVVHLAAETGTGQSMYEVARYCHTNVVGTAVLLEGVQATRGAVSKVVVASSRAIYGEGKYALDGEVVYPRGRREKDLAAGLFEPRCERTGRVLRALATDEGSAIQPDSMYGITKHTQEQMVMLAGRAHGIGTSALRFQNVYGPGQSLVNPYTGILSIFSTRILNGKGIDVYEDGQESRDFVFIDDVVDSIVLALPRGPADGEVFGIGTGVATSVLTVARTLVAAYGRDVPVKVTGAYRVGDIRHNFADTEKSRNILGFRATVGFTEGIRRFAEWVLGQPLPADRYEESLAALKDRGLYK